MAPKSYEYQMQLDIYGNISNVCLEFLFNVRDVLGEFGELLYVIVNAELVEHMRDGPNRYFCQDCFVLLNIHDPHLAIYPGTQSSINDMIRQHNYFLENFIAFNPVLMEIH